MADTTFLDWPFFEPHHSPYYNRIAEFAAGWGHAASEEDDMDATCRRLVSDFGRQGFLESVVPSAGPGAFDVRTICLAREALSRYSGLADVMYAMQGLGSAPITFFGSPEQRERWLPAVREGRSVAAFALSEPEAGSDVASMETSAVRVDGGWKLNGVKTWISNGGIADQYIVFARTGEAPGARGISAFIVAADNPGLSIEKRLQIIAPHPIATIRFTDCHVPADALIGEPGQGFKIAMATLDVFRTTVGAASLGFARRALDDAGERASRRRVMGKPLIEQQIIQAKIADMAMKVDASALLVYRSAWTRDKLGKRVTRESSMAKLYATEAAQKVVDEAVQIFGGLGVTLGSKIEELYRDVRAPRIYEGASEVQALIVAKHTMQLLFPQANV